MSPMTPQDRFVSRRRAQRGQTLIVALAILFLLLFIGGLFVTRIGRNVVAAGRSRDTSDAQALAQAGLDYCNNQLNATPNGADWRPVPTTPLNNADPDYYYLERGFTRLSLNGGRALVRVAYDPHPANPLGQAMRIESVGIPGVVDPNDPTVFTVNGHTSRLRRELIAYKQIGLTDYGLYITNKDRRTESNYVGTPAIGNAVATVLGNPMLGYSKYSNGLGLNNQVLYGFPMRVDGNLTLGDDTYLYESPRGQLDVLGNPDPTLQQEKLLVSGTISLLAQHRSQVYGTVDDTTYPAYLNQEIDMAPSATTTNAAGTAVSGVIRASNDPLYTTYQGTVRDGSLSPDMAGWTRGVPYQAPPDLDAEAVGSGVLRYRALTRDSGYYYTPSGSSQALNTGQYGYGTGIYINNIADLQPESTDVAGASSLRASWIDPKSDASDTNTPWKGPVYQAPGVLVELLGDTIRLTRDDGSFSNADGTPNANGNGSTLIIPLDDTRRTTTTLATGPNGPITWTALPHYGDNGGANSPFFDKNSYGVNVVLFAEGNVRVRGVYGVVTNPANNTMSLGRVHITIVSGGTAYIEGNVVRGDGYVNNGQTVYEHASTCAILAHDYVCVNSTQFMAPQQSASSWSQDEASGIFDLPISSGPTGYETGFSFGVDPSTYITNGNPSPVYLLLRHGVLNPPNTTPYTAINLLVNQGLPVADVRYNSYLFNEYGASGQYSNAGNGYFPTPETYLIGLKYPQGGAVSVADPDSFAPLFEMKAFPLNETLHGKPIDYNTITNATVGNLPVNLRPGYVNTILFQIDTTALGQLSQNTGNNNVSTTSNVQPYLLGSVMVAPLDIRIEAALYAQERSFFIIPGYALNPNSADTRQSYTMNHVRISYQDDASNPTASPDTAEDRQDKDIYPFYNEPADVRITIFGSVSENYAASQSDQQAWMSHWGFIPAYYGSSTLPVPDDHLTGRDIYTNIAAQEYANLMPGLDTTLDYRTPIEKFGGTTTGLPANVNTITADTNPFPITRGLRMMYDPAFAMPYYWPTDNNLSPDTAYPQRKQRALRSITTTINVPNGPSYTIEQVLPAIPCLPMCPNYVYAGDADRLIASYKYDTDNLSP